MNKSETFLMRNCTGLDMETWISLNREFMSYEIQDGGFWNNTDKNSDGQFASTFKEAMDNPEMIRLFIIESEGKAIGFANVMIIFSVWSHGRALILDDLYIKEEFRGGGIGRSVMEYLERYSRAQGFMRLQFQSEHTNPAAHKFYTKLGYTSEGMNFYVRYL